MPGIGLTNSTHSASKAGAICLSHASICATVFNLGELMLHDREAIDRNTVALHVANVQRDQLPRRRVSSTDVLVRALAQVECPVAAIYGACDALYPVRWMRWSV